MADSTPRHLAERSRRFGLSPLQQLFLVAMLSLAAISAVIALLTRDTGTGRRPAGPATTRAQAAATPSTAPATTGPTTTGPAPQPIRPTPGNLLADGDFERDLGGWTALGGATLQRVQGGASGRWAVAVAPGPSSGRPAVGSASSMSSAAIVLFPAPLGPVRATISPGSRSRSRSATAG